MDAYTVNAEDVREGDVLPRLDNGYVFETVSEASDILQWSGGNYAALDKSLVYIGFHDALGNENHILLQGDHPVQVER